MTITIRPERPDDYRATEILTREAFWDVYKPRCDEHLIVHKLRERPAFVADLDLVGVTPVSSAKCVDRCNPPVPPNFMSIDVVHGPGIPALG